MSTEIYILAGLLGSGKTTLLKQLLQDEKENGRKVAVLMNELGKVSIDSDAIDEDIPLKELLDGCICCTIQDKLEGQLQGLLTVEKPDVIYIEATGAAHPVEVLDAVLSPLFANSIVPKGIISILDSARWLNRKELTPQVLQLLVEQIRHADCLLVNKIDLLSEDEQANVIQEVQSINSTAFTLLTKNAKVPIKRIRELSLLPKEKQSSSRIGTDLHLSTFVYQFKGAVDQSAFEDFLRELPDTLYRMKGYIKFSSLAYPQLFQFSYGMPVYFQEEMNIPLNMVFIGENIDWDKIESGLQSLEKPKEYID
ncbi:GTP-binding protein [Cytobacillus kochii]|uniref:CobW family GTP-binding protein n=1 Tax=Cytobacillus kochii TaxID=859143 RepID=UPI001CD69F3F|nr:GTP-binding protein [Cytobacillus kochii]MCA1027277.1 GTP-binding protein [Cytobacillus kochii]